MKRFYKLLSLFVSLCILATVFTSLPVVARAENDAEDPDVEFSYVENELLIRTDNTVYTDSTLASNAVYAAVEANLSCSIDAEISIASFCSVDETASVYSISLDNIDNANISIPDLCADINADNDDIYAEPNYLYELAETSLDTGLELQEFESLVTTNGIYSNWHLRDTFATEALNFCEKKGDDILVAVIDTGCNFNHEHLQNSMITFTMGPDIYHGFNVTGDDYSFDIIDNHGHGTAVASVISGNNTTNNVAGVAYNSKILPIKVISNDSITEYSLIKAIDKIKEYNNHIVGKFEGADQKVSIINMSLARIESSTYKYYDSSIKVALESISDECVLVAAAGNDEMSTKLDSAYPASFDNVIGVMAYDSTRTMAYYSNYDERGYHYNIAAPGSSITVALHSANNSYGLSSGTSFASPIVAGAIALYMSNCPNATIEKVKSDLLSSMTDKVKPYYDDDVEHFKLNIVSYLNKGLLTDDSVFSGSCGYDNVTWTYTHSNHSLVISGGDMIDDYTRGNTPWYRFRDLITNCNISDDIVYIGDYAFTDLSVLNDLDLGEGIEYIGDLSFAYCKSLQTLNMPQNEIEIALGSFFGCSSLTNITLPPSLYSPGSCSYLFQNCTALKSIVIPTGWTILPSGMFFGCTSLDSVTLSDALQRIDAVAFKNCYALESLDLPESLVELRPRAFENCTGFTSLEMPRSLTKIGLNVFTGCTGLQSITLYDNITTMRSKIFENCPNVTVKAYYNSVPLTYAQTNEIDYEIMYRINPIENSEIIFDRTNNMILNLPSDVLLEAFSEQYVQLDSGFTLEYETVISGVVSGGTVVKVLKGDTVVETYTVD